MGWKVRCSDSLKCHSQSCSRIHDDDDDDDDVLERREEHFLTGLVQIGKNASVIRRFVLPTARHGGRKKGRSEAVVTIRGHQG